MSMQAAAQSASLVITVKHHRSLNTLWGLADPTNLCTRRHPAVEGRIVGNAQKQSAGNPCAVHECKNIVKLGYAKKPITKRFAAQALPLLHLASSQMDRLPGPEQPLLRLPHQLLERGTGLPNWTPGPSPPSAAPWCGCTVPW